MGMFARRVQNLRPGYRFSCFCAAAGFMLLAAAVCPARAGSLKIGEISPLSGRLAKQGLEIDHGIQVAIDMANRRGGVSGRKIVLLSRDDQSRPGVAISRAEELCSFKKVVALTGGYVDALVGPIAAVAQKYKVPYVASASLQKELAQHRNRYFFRVSRLRGFIEPLCGILTKQFKPRRLAVLYAATPGATELAQDLKSCLATRNIRIAMLEKFRPGTPDFTSLILKLAAQKIDVVVSAGFTPDHMLMVRQFKEHHFSPKAYIGPFGIASMAFVAAMGPDAEYLYGTCAWNPGITMPGTEAASKTFIRQFSERYQHAPNTTNMHGYTSAMALIGAMRSVAAAGLPLTGNHIRDALSRLDMVLPMEHLTFDAHGNPRHYHHVVVQIQHGRLVPVFPPGRAAAAAIFPAPAWGKR